MINIMDIFVFLPQHLWKQDEYYEINYWQKSNNIS